MVRKIFKHFYDIKIYWIDYFHVIWYMCILRHEVSRVYEFMGNISQDSLVLNYEAARNIESWIRYMMKKDKENRREKQKTFEFYST